MADTGGLLLSFEGIDGCGKSTQVELLVYRLQARGMPVTSVREPGGTKVGEQIRKVLLQTDYSLTVHTETLLYMAARSELVHRVIMPALSGNSIVICDRFTDSTLAYQGYGGGMELNWIKGLNRKLTAGCFPDLTFLLDLSVEEAAARRGSDADRMEKKEHSYHHRVRHGYLDIACRNRDRVIIIDASKKPEQQNQEIWNELSPRLKDFLIERQ